MPCAWWCPESVWYTAPSMKVLNNIVVTKGRQKLQDTPCHEIYSLEPSSVVNNVRRAMLSLPIAPFVLALNTRRLPRLYASKHKNA
jgi:hypothetical protein